MNLSLLSKICLIALVAIATLIGIAAEARTYHPHAATIAKAVNLTGWWQGLEGTAVISQSGESVVIDTNANVLKGTVHGKVISGSWRSRENSSGGRFRITVNGENKVLGWYAVDFYNNAPCKLVDYRTFYAARENN